MQVSDGLCVVVFLLLLLATWWWLLKLFNSLKSPLDFSSENKIQISYETPPASTLREEDFLFTLKGLDFLPHSLYKM